MMKMLLHRMKRMRWLEKNRLKKGWTVRNLLRARLRR